jgi:PBP1b-binding outer membrane lipoprotein LpoB
LQIFAVIFTTAFVIGGCTYTGKVSPNIEAETMPTKKRNQTLAIDGRKLIDK